MRYDEMTQNFRFKGEVCPKNNPTKRWRIVDVYDDSCLLKEVNGVHGKHLDYDELDRDWMPYKKPKSKPVVIESAKDKFGNELRIGDEVYYAMSYHWGRGYAIEKGKVTGFTPCYVLVDGGSVSPDKIGKI